MLLELELDDSGVLMSGDDGAAQPGKTWGRTAEFKAARSRAKEDSQSERSAASDSERVLGSDPALAARADARRRGAPPPPQQRGRRRRRPAAPPRFGAAALPPLSPTTSALLGLTPQGARRRRRRGGGAAEDVGGVIFEETPGLARRAEAAVNAETDEELLGEEYLQVCHPPGHRPAARSLP